MPIDNSDNLLIASFINAPLWERARWVATTFGWHPRSESPPYMGIVFNDAEAGQAIFRDWIRHLGRRDLFEELRVSIIEGNVCSQRPGYSVHITADPVGVMNRALSEGIEVNPRQLVAFGKVNRMHPAPDSPPLLPQFRKEFEKHQKFLLAPVICRGDGRLWLDVKTGFEKTMVHFRDAADIVSDEDLDAAVTHLADYVPWSADGRKPGPLGLER